MKWWLYFFAMIGYVSMAQAVCPQPIKFYVDCGSTRTINDMIQFCHNHQMTLVNITNSTGTLVSDIVDLSNSFISNNCSGYFMYSYGNQTSLISNVNSVAGLLNGLLAGTLNLNLCITPLLCLVTTTVAPINTVLTVCTRPVQQSVALKCSIPSVRFDKKEFLYIKQSMYAGFLNTFPVRSRAVCNGVCSLNDTCLGTLYGNGNCTMYM